MQRAIGRGHAFDGQNPLAGKILYQSDANPARFVVHEDRASAARPDVAGVLRTGQVEVFAQEFNDALLHRACGHFDLAAIDEEFHGRGDPWVDRRGCSADW